MIRHLYLFCFLFLVLFSCHSGKKVVEDDPRIVACKQKALYNYYEGEDHFNNNEYELARFRYAEALADSCLVGMKETYKTTKRFGKKEILVTELIAQRIKQIDKIRFEKIKVKQDQCSKILQHAENLFVKHDYEYSRSYFQRYQTMDCAEDDSVVISRIKLLDSLINVKKN